MTRTLWCWYHEGDNLSHTFYDRKDAIRDAIMAEMERESVLVGTAIDAMDAVVGFLDVRDIVETLDECMNVDDSRLRHGPKAQEALEAWAREHLEFDAHTVCLDGDVVSEEEWNQVQQQLIQEDRLC